MSATELPVELTAALASVTGADGATLPPAVYADDAIFAREQERLFRGGWCGVGRADRWPDTGAYVTLTLGGVPLVIVRGDDGRLRCFDNTCSHRANLVMTGEGTCVRMTCNFHAWTYRLDGSVHGAPSMQRTPGFDRSDHGLHEFACEERLGFAFVNLADDPRPIDDVLGDFAAVHQPWPLADLVTGRRREFDVECNWKAFAEVFNEYYHLPYVHPDSISGTYLEPDDLDEVKGDFASQFGVTDGTGGLLDGAKEETLPTMPGLSGRPAEGTRYTWLFPNMTFAVGAEAVWMYEVYPIAPGVTRCAQTVCFPPEVAADEAAAAQRQAYIDRVDLAISEDIPVLEQQFLGQSSGFARQGRFSHLEPAVAAFAAWYAERIAE